MRCCKKASVFLSLLLVCGSLFAATSNKIEIKTAELQAEDNYYQLNADINISFDKEIEEAINKGVPLNFVVEFQIVSPRQYWFDDEVVTATQNIMLSYHALTRQYLVNRGKHQQSFESLGDAIKDFGALSEWKVVEKSLLEKGELYNAALLIRLDQNKLPKAIQVDAIASEKWNIASEKFEWTLKDLPNKDLNNKELNGKEVNGK